MPKATQPRDVRGASDATVRAARGSLFVTGNINFAAYLKASQRLVWDHVEVHAKYSEFYFRDPCGAGGPGKSSRFRRICDL